MSLLLFILALPLTFGESNSFSLSSYPSCFMEGIAWSSEESIDVIPNIDTLYSCQKLCLDSGGCNYFSWYSEQSVSFQLVCFLFNSPTTQSPCTGCFSGPQSCTCSDIFSCEISSDNVIDTVSDVEMEVFCQENCINTDGCTVYTWYTQDFHPFPNYCFLFSSCDKKDFSCSNCFSGPPNCIDISNTTTLNPPTTTTFICELPDPPEHGEWFCPPSADSMFCYLECFPGYVPEGESIITCTDGSWSSSLSCVEAFGLITGSYSSPRNTVEVYGEGVHKHLPNLPGYRFYHTLDYVDSKVLLCGIDDQSCIAFTEAQQWVFHSNTTAKRVSHGSVVVLNQLHLLGGIYSPTSTEFLDPATGSTWTQGWDLLEDTPYACATKISPETLLTTGGGNDKISAISYNVSSGAVTRLMDLSTPRWNHGCVHVRDPQRKFTGVIVAGGYSKGDYLSSSEIYDLNEGTWTETGQLTVKRSGVRLVVLRESILAFGGYDGRNSLSSVDSFNLTSMEWSAGESMLQTRSFHAVTGVPPSLITGN